VLNTFNTLKPSDRGTRGEQLLGKHGACATRTDRREWDCRRRREDDVWISDDTWLILIGCLDFYHFNNFNSIISLENNFFFTKIHDFFSL